MGELAMIFGGWGEEEAEREDEKMSCHAMLLNDLSLF